MGKVKKNLKKEVSMKELFQFVIFLFKVIVFMLILIDISLEGAIKFVIFYLGFKEILKTI